MFKSQFLDNYSIELYTQYIKICANQKDLNLRTQIYIDRYTEKMNEIGIVDPEIENCTPFETLQVSSILGVFEGCLQSYLIVCKKCELVAQALQQKYYRIQSVNFIGLKFLIEKKQNPQEYELIQQLKDFLAESFYFSLYGNPCLPLQHSFSKGKDYNEFSWNNHLIQRFIDSQIQPSWYSKLIQGYVSQVQAKLENYQLKYVLISRKSKHQSGTRFHHRGINDDGFVANFVMTENIIFIEELCFSYVTYRGSVPIFWKQSNAQSKVKITRNENLCIHAYMKHFHDLQQQYRLIHCVNLMGDNTSESILNEAFRNLIDANKLEGVTLERIDFHKVCKHDKTKQIDAFIRAVDKQTKVFDCFSFNVKTNNVLTLQLGSYRINCLDCLDRTNAYQSRLCMRIINLLLQKKDFPLQIDLLLMFEDTKYSDFLNQYRVIWAENGNSISQLYCGTNATTSELTKKGKKTIKGFFSHNWASLNRLFNQQFFDSSKNSTIQTFLHGVQTQKSQLEVYLTSQIKNYCKFQKMKIYSVTWNVNSKMVDNLITDILKFDKDFLPDIIIFGLQEIIKLNAQNVIGEHSDLVNKWQKVIDINLFQTGEQYQFVQSENLVGILLMIYVRKQLVPQITNITTDTIKTGFEGHIGNKGACLIRFQINDTVISVCNCHLAAGNKKNKRRIQSLQEIHEKTFQLQVKRLDQTDYTILLGDFNFRLELSQQEALNMISEYNQHAQQGKHREAEQSIIKLQQFDQAYVAKQMSQLQEYQEGGISFLPTYKLQDAHIYDISKQKHVPSYCDRIFIKTNEELGVKLLQYRSINRFESDHQPVIAMFILDIKQIDRVREKSLIQEFSNKNQELEVEDSNYFSQQSKQLQDGAVINLVESNYEGKKSFTQKIKDKLLNR